MEVAQQVLLALIGGRKSGVTSLAGQRQPGMWRRYQAGDSQSGAGADDQTRSVGAGLAWLDLDQRIGLEVGHAQGLSSKIIDQLEPLKTERLLQLAVRKDPGAIGELDAIRVGRAGKGQARFLRCGPGIEPDLAQIAAYRLYRAGVLGGGQGKDLPRHELPRCDQGEASIGATDITDQGGAGWRGRKRH